MYKNVRGDFIFNHSYAAHSCNSVYYRSSIVCEPNEAIVDVCSEAYLQLGESHLTSEA